jgi:hypothetical protein
MAVNEYIAGFRFEQLLSKVYPLRSVNANKSLLENALTMEQGKTFAKHLGSTEKQFSNAQKKIIETLSKLQTKPPYNTAEEDFEAFAATAEQCNSATSLSEVVEEALLKASSLDNSGNWKNKN